MSYAMDIVERLRESATRYQGSSQGHYWNLCEEAAGEIVRLRQERDSAQARTAEAL